MTENLSYTFALKKFCTQTSIQGLRFVDGFNAKFTGRRRLWFIVFLISLIITCWQCSLNVESYLKFGIKTSVTYSISKEQTIPAITTCNTNSFRRSIIAPSKLAFLFLIRMFSDNELWFQYLLYINRNQRTCKAVVNETNVLQDFDENPQDYMMKHPFDQVMKTVSLNSELNVEKCWWKEKEINCTKMMFDHVTMDRGPCFTVNPSKDQNELYANIFDFLDAENIQSKVLCTTTAGPRNGLRLLLNVRQDEYCGLFKEALPEGAGFNAYLHEQASAGLDLSSQSISLQPGRSYDIMVHSTNYIKQTEFLGYCKSTMEIKSVGFKGPYSISICLALCYMELVAQNCECLPIFFGSNFDVINKIFETNYTTCGSEKMICMGTYSEKFYKGDKSNLCSKCISQCSETRFTSTITEMAFPAKRGMKYFQDEYKLQKAVDVQKNLLVINIYFDNMFVENIEESQAFTFIDLTVYFGNNTLLFLGMSIMSLFEPIYIGLVFLYIFIQHTAKRIWYLQHKHIFQKKWKRQRVIKIEKQWQRKIRVHAVVATNMETLL